VCRWTYCLLFRIGIPLVGGYGNVLRSLPTFVDAFQRLAST